MKLIERFISNETAVINALLNQKSIPSQEIAKDIAEKGEVVSYQSGNILLNRVITIKMSITFWLER